MRDEKINNLLDFWTLCEITDFERFKLDAESIAPFDTEQIEQTKSLKSEYNKHTDINNKTIPVYRVYIGIIKSDKAIKFIYKKLKARNLIPDSAIKKSDEDIEKLPSMPEYTYMGYIYLDSNLNMISITDASLVINPLFYILKNLLEKSLVNTHSYNEFADRVSREFSAENNIDSKSKTYVIPDLQYMLSAVQNFNSIKFLSQLENCTICILNKLYEDIKTIAEDDKHPEKSYAEILLKLLNSEKEKKSNFIFPTDFNTSVSSGNKILDSAIVTAKQKHSCFIYLLTKDTIDIDIKIPPNLFLISFINNTKKLSPSLSYNKDRSENKITEEKLKNIFQALCQQLYLVDEENRPVDIFYKKQAQNLSIFSKKYHDKTFDKIDKLEESKFLSYYINALDEEPQKLSIPYMKGVAEKIDINEDTHVRKKYNTLEIYKKVNSRWASSYTLNYAQQMAVNLFLNKLNKDDNNIFSVNGPPGTGKTTLLKDIIANVITKRVQHCINLDGEIFDANGLIKKEFCGKYEIIVTSNNNAAVENITLELPKEDAFDFEYIAFSKEDFLLSKLSDIFYEKDSWNFISINLGNGQNINSFKEKFNDFKNSIERNSDLTNKDMLNTRKNKIIEKINKCKNHLTKEEEIFQKLEKFEILNEKKETLKKTLNNLCNAINHLKSKANQTKSQHDKSKQTQNEILEKIRISEKIIELKKSELTDYNIIKKLFRFKDYNIVKQALSSQEKLLSTNLTELQKIKSHVSSLSGTLETQTSELSLLTKQQEKEKNHLSSLSILCETLSKELHKYNINNDTFYRQDESKLQKSSLYNKKEYIREKALLFALSMQLSEVFFLQNFDNFCKAIDNFFIDFKKTINDKEKRELQQNFSALFFILPAVSTSLASSYNMLKSIKEYGILLCDESGQATPQSLIGLLNRANNALIVGDPLQIEPVFTAPAILISLIQEMYEVEDKFSPILSSAQVVADQANHIGSYYEIDNDRIWVGMPLVVHRRCIEPMFSLSNKIVYNGKMVLATKEMDNDDPINQLPKSGWIDVKSDENDFLNNGNTSLKEIQVLCNFIEKYSGLLVNNYYVISPFKNIYSAVKNCKEFDSDENKAVGTVHTFQGKEEEIVFFILGGNTSGSKNWVSSKPNLLNVANTRAKKRIYFIGDYDLWKEHKYFNTAISLLEKIIYKED